jgi:hypothetical protein
MLGFSGKSFHSSIPSFLPFPRECELGSCCFLVTLYHCNHVNNLGFRFEEEFFHAYGELSLSEGIVGNRFPHVFVECVLITP